MVKPKKHLGQHFLHDKNICKKIVDALSENDNLLIEVGPGTGALTSLIIEQRHPNFKVVEIDVESIDYLKYQYPSLDIFSESFLTLDFSK
ncbi:MAG: 16S rRNA (adenine(1518)-N(6)/adenine(1519)-N(6))-dimethyltransferase, partial [Flavobacteriales bacterium]|nr:16S rRNA (adenine(1518)-N(6)/adenine(1519)-N(6))-dimethyltransferase [Flavobacteriales bacterium]